MQMWLDTLSNLLFSSRNVYARRPAGTFHQTQGPVVRWKLRRYTARPRPRKHKDPFQLVNAEWIHSFSAHIQMTMSLMILADGRRNPTAYSIASTVRYSSLRLECRASLLVRIWRRCRLKLTELRFQCFARSASNSGWLRTCCASMC